MSASATQGGYNNVIGKAIRITYKNIEQEGQHPLTGQRAPPISGGI